MAAPDDRPVTPLRGFGPPAGYGALVFVVGDSIDRADVPGLCELVRALVPLTGGRIICDVGAIVDPDAVTIDALARLQLTALRLGGRIILRDASRELQDLLALTGLNDVLPLCAELPVQAKGKAEERKEARRIQEETDPADPFA